MDGGNSAQAVTVSDQLKKSSNLATVAHFSSDNSFIVRPIENVTTSNVINEDSFSDRANSVEKQIFSRTSVSE